MGKKEEYKEKNLQFLKELSLQEGVFSLPGNIYYRIPAFSTLVFEVELLGIA